MNKFYGAHDQWTDLDKQNDVLITSTDGVIDSVKVNGEEYGGGGSSDFSTAEVTVITGVGEEFLVLIPAVDTDSNLCNAVYQFGGQFEHEIIVPLYKGKAAAQIDGQYTVSVTGNAEFDEEEYTVVITGNCTISVS